MVNLEQAENRINELHKRLYNAVGGMTRDEILDKAKDIINGQRQQDYGSPKENFSTIAKLWTEYTGTLITSVDVCCMMLLLKIARVKNVTGTADCFIDMAGYAALAGELLKTENK